MPPVSRLRLVALPVVVYLLTAACVFGAIWHLTGGHFTYTLDDPYIHMAVAGQLAHGHYGINASEWSSPSSSVLWPFLLEPFANNAYAPLLWNLLAGLVSATLIGLAVAEWPASENANDTWVKPLSTLALLLTGNVIGVTFLGMEHGLQVMLAVCCAFGICRALNGHPIPLWCVAAAAIAPMIRYEDLILTLAIGVALAGARRWRLAVSMGIVAIAPLIAFSAFLHSKGLPLLPLSVLVKGKATDAHASAALTIIRLLTAGIFRALTDPQRWPMVVLLLIVAAAAWQSRERVRRFTLAGAAAAIALQLTFGRFGWFHRYEVYALVFGAIIVLRLLREHSAPRLGWYAMGLLALTMPYAQAIPDSVLSAQDVYGQQYQMHRFATEFYSGNVAVNDLGLVSYKLGDSRYVLDFGGLASLETARTPVKTTAWVEGMVQRYNVGMVMIYPNTVPIPAQWQKLGTICLVHTPIALFGSCVDFYATSATAAQPLRPAFANFTTTLPRQTTATIGP
jgi:hypothetical protein